MTRATNMAITAIIIGALVIRALSAGRRAASVLDVSGVVIGATPSGHADLEHAGVSSGAGVPASRNRAWLLAIICGVVDAAANVIMLLALRIGDLSIVSALTALYPAGTIILAAVVLKERVGAVQWAGLALALIAGGMLALA